MSLFNCAARDILVQVPIVHPKVPTAYEDSVNPNRALPVPAAQQLAAASASASSLGGSVVRRKSMLPQDANTQRALEEYQSHNLQ